MSNDKKALIALMDLVLALADSVVATEGQCSPRGRRVQDGATRLRAIGALCEDGAAARTAVAATERRYGAWRRELEKTTTLREPIGVRPARWQLMQELKDLAGNPLDPHFGLEVYEGLEGDDSRVTDGHKPYGGKPGCGCSVCRCARSVGG